MLEPLLEGHHPKPHPDFCIQRRDSFSYLEPCPRGVVQLLSRVRVFATPWTAARQASPSFTISLSLLRLVSIESLMPSNHLALFRPFLLLPSICPSIRVFSNELASHIKWPKYWSFSFRISPSNEYSGSISFRVFKNILFINFFNTPNILFWGITY